VPACQAGCGFSFDAAASSSVAATAPQQLPQQPPQPQGRPSFISISLPNLLGQINRMMPQLGQHMMMMRQQQQQHPMLMSAADPLHHSMMEDDMEDLEDELDDLSPFLRGNSAAGSSSSEESEEESRENADAEDSVEFPLMSSGLSAPPVRNGMDSWFGRKDEEEADLVDPFFGGLFSNVQQQMSRMMQSFPRVWLRMFP
jgi:hypothetical protein